MRRSPESRRPLLIAASLALTVLAGLPVWRTTTRIPRPPLPLVRVRSAASLLKASAKLRLPLRFNVYSRWLLDAQSQRLLSDDDPKGQLQFARLDVDVRVLATVDLQTPGHSDLACAVPEGQEAPTCLAEHLDQSLPNAYSFIHSMPAETDPSTASTASPDALHRQVEDGLDQALMGLIRFVGDGHDVASDILMTITLCNADPRNGFWLWNFDQITSEWLNSTFQQLTPFVNIAIRSQVIFDCDLSVEARWHPKLQAFFVEEQELPFFVGSDWDVDPIGKVASSLDGDGIPPKAFHFVTYIPPKSKTPLVVQADAATTQSFFVPSWGGVHILNKHTLLKKQDTTSRIDELNEDDVEALVGSVATQLRLFLGLTEIPTQGDLSSPRSELNGFADNEIKALILKKLLQDVQSSVYVLSSLADLVEEIPNLEVPHLIQTQVLQSLWELEAALEAAEAGDFLTASRAAGRSRHLSELAFSHPSIASKENFPAEHKLGIYMPLFLPALLSLAIACIAELRGFLRRGS